MRLLKTMKKNNILVRIPAKKEIAYEIFIDDDTIYNLKNKINKFCIDKKILVVISEKVEKLYGDKLCFANGEKFILKDGENQKNLKNYKKILDKAQKINLERKDVIIAIGGGGVGDITGFVASTYLRGIDFIQVPTTLLSMVDSSVGGKVAVNTEFGKNLVGAFYQPKAVFINLSFLKTLDERQFLSGMGEVVKYSFIEKTCQNNKGLNLFDILSDNYEKILARDLEIFLMIITFCLKLKASVVEKDEREENLRRILNFGHTYGHALERLTNYKKFTHGEAIVYGMIFAFEISLKKAFITIEYFEKSIQLIKKFFEITDLKINKKKIFKLMMFDKKVENKEIRFILPVENQNVIIVNVSNFE